MNSIRPLDKKFQPKLVTLELGCSPAEIEQVYQELRARAETDDYKCFGYFPGMQTKATGLTFDLPQSKKLADKLSLIHLDNKDFLFSFLRTSLIKQGGIASHHVDSDASAALTGSIAKVSDTYIWRLLINLNDKHHRTLSYLAVDPASMNLKNTNGYVHYAGEVSEDFIRLVDIPARQGDRVSAVIFCASRVLHAGRDDEFGHFLAGYGCELKALEQ